MEIPASDWSRRYLTIDARYSDDIYIQADKSARPQLLEYTISNDIKISGGTDEDDINFSANKK